jgi:hypothetical protein
MRCEASCILAFVLWPTYLISSFSFIRFVKKSGQRFHGSGSAGFFAGSEGDDEEGEEQEGLPSIRKNAFKKSNKLINGIEERSLQNGIMESLDTIVQDLLLKMAVNTTALYFDGFGNIASMKWIKQHNNFENAGFRNGSSHVYIESMISRDAFDVKIRLPVTKTAKYQLVGENKEILKQLHGHKNVDNFRIQSTERLEPRRILHRILTTRESICKEMIVDLQSIPDDNLEAIKFAELWMKEGKLKAESHRSLTRFTDDDGVSSPFREQNFLEFNILLMNVAIELSRNELQLDGTKNALATIRFLDSFIADSEETSYEELDDSSLFPIAATCLHDDKKVSRSLLESLYFEGITKSFITLDQEAINLLKLARGIMLNRTYLATCFIEIIRRLGSESYSKMIQDRGGFKKFDIDNKAKFQLIDLDE